MGYRDLGSGTKIDPVFETDLNTTPITLVVGDPATILTVTVQNNNGSGDGIPFYQWYRNGAAIPGATGHSYAAPTNVAGTFNYYVKVGNATGGVNTSQSREVKIIPTEIVVGNGSGETPIYFLKEVIMTLLNDNPTSTVPYTVNFNMDLPYPILINDEDFPGAGKLTVKSKSNVTFSKGIYITRSEVELNGLRIEIGDARFAALDIYQDPCAVLVSDRYFLASEHKPTPPEDVDTYKGYDSYVNNAIKNVSIVDCKIVFRTNNNNRTITGINVDPYTAGRTTGTLDTRVKILNTTVDVFNGGSGLAQCFYGDNTDFSKNIFISNRYVANFQFLLKLSYGDLSETNTVSFLNNKFTSTAPDNRVFNVDVNYAAAVYDSDQILKSKMEEIQSTCYTFGTNTHKFGELASIYRRLIEILFDQIPSTSRGGTILLMNDYYNCTPSSKTPLTVKYKMNTGPTGIVMTQ